MKEESKISKIIGGILVIVFIFIVGYTIGYTRCANKYLKNYEAQLTKVALLSKRASELSITFDSIKKSPCYNNKIK